MIFNHGHYFSSLLDRIGDIGVNAGGTTSRRGRRGLREGYPFP